MPSEGLKAILKQMITVYENILLVGKEKQEALIKGEHEQLLSIFPKEAALLKEISLLEDQRQAETASFNASTLTEILTNLSTTEGKEELLAYQKELKVKLNELEAQHALNQQLIETSLQYVNNMLALFTQKQQPSITYSGKQYGNQKDTAHSRRFFDAKV